MPKLQRIKRTNGTFIYSINFPCEIIEKLGWEKGSELIMEIRNIGENKIAIIFKEDGLNLVEEN